MSKICEIATRLVNNGTVPKNSPLGILGMLNSPARSDRHYAVAKILGASDEVELKDAQGRVEVIALDEYIEMRMHTPFPPGFLMWGMYAGVKR